MINLLITGGCGFIGSGFINHIYKTGKYKIINIDVIKYCADENNIDEEIRNSPNYILVKKDITNMQDVLDTLHRYSINQVIHFAAQSHVQRSFDDSLQFTHDNVFGTHVILESCRLYGKIDRIIHVSTDEVYGESMLNEDHKTENSTLCPTNPYAASKAGAELLAKAYYFSYKMPIIITRGNNVYGPNQYPEKLIPCFVALLKQNRPVTIQGTGNQLRSFLHLTDTVKAFEIILEKGQIGEIYNIGCDHNMEYTVKQVSEILIKLIKKTDDYNAWTTYVEDRPFNDQRYFISNDKLKQLGWNITVQFEEGILSCL